ncbi:MAG: TolC family protein [Candidatus Aminicenantes bacterium]|nr:MAG: TolC family protein [Candidatus Aminicenantes bacterium]
MCRRVILFVIAAMLNLSFSYSGTAAETADIPRLSLKEVQDYAVKHSIETRNARLDVRMAKKKIWETTATGLPQVSAKVSYLDNLQLPTTLIPAQFIDPDAEEGEFIGVKFGTQHNATLSITVDQLIFSGSYIVGLQASRIYLRLSQEQLIKTEIDVKEAVTRTYYLILLAEDNKKTLEANLENVKKILFESRELYKAGFAEDTDVDQLQLTVTDLENAIKSMDRQIQVTYKLLKYQMGFDLEKEVRLSRGLADILSEMESKELLTADFDITGHIDYRMLDTQEKSLGLLLRREKSEYLPNISAFISHSQMAMRESFNFFNKDETWFPSTMIGLSIDIPIFSSGMRSARVAQAKMDLEKAKNSKKKVVDGLRLELVQARSDFANALETAQKTKDNVKLAKKIYDKTLIKYTNGTASSLELTQTHSQYLTAESNYTQAVVELLNAKTRLDKALNRL